MEKKYIKGLPSLLFLPAVDYVMEESNNVYKIELPVRGNYALLTTEFFEGEFEIYNNETKTVDLTAITKVLLAAKKYPALEPNQIAVPLSITMNEDSISMSLQVLNMVNVEKE